MCPTFARAYMPYQSLGDFVFSGNRTVPARVCPNRQDLRHREANPAVSFAAWGCSVRFPVDLIAASRPPAKIVEAIVCSHPVAVTALATCRWVTSERLQNESMDKHLFHKAVFPKTDSKVATTCVDLFLDALTDRYSVAASTTHRLDAPDVADLVQALVSTNDSPDFAHSQLPKVDRDEARGSRHGDRLSGATLATRGVV